MLLVRQEIALRNWLVEDPLEEIGTGSIAGKVHDSLGRANALVAECSTSSPNVMYELGVAQALGYPIVLLINSATFDDPKLEQYLRFLRASHEKPTPADLGDVEYLAYDDDLSGARRAQLEARLKKAFATVARRVGGGHVRLEAATKRLFSRLADIRNAHVSESGAPLLRFLGGWIDKLAEDLEKGERTGFEVDAEFYDRCFRNFGDLRKDARAVADLTDTIEGFWLEKANQKHLPVLERIFAISAMDLVNTDRIHEIVAALKEHKELHQKSGHGDYQVRIAPLMSGTPAGEKLFGDETCGHHMLLFDPEMTAGYVERDARIFLRVVSDYEVHAKARALYDEIRENSLEFEADAKALRRRWLEREKIGHWDPQWNNQMGPSSTYFTQYDLNIRCWIPRYDYMIKHTAVVAVEELRRLQKSRPPTRGGMWVLEVGCGTGALTGAILDRVAESRPSGFLRRLIATDRAQEMIRRAKSRLPEGEVLKYELCTAFSGCGERVERRRRDKGFDLVCGSLVLHDILRLEPSLDDLTKALARCGELLAPDGVAIFADSFIRVPSQRELIQEAWAGWMTEFGLSTETVEGFFAHNQDMLHTLTDSLISDAIQAGGFRGFEFREVPGLDKETPFHVLVMRKA